MVVKHEPDGGFNPRVWNQMSVVKSRKIRVELATNFSSNGLQTPQRSLKNRWTIEDKLLLVGKPTTSFPNS